MGHALSGSEVQGVVTEPGFPTCPCQRKGQENDQEQGHGSGTHCGVETEDVGEEDVAEDASGTRDAAGDTTRERAGADMSAFSGLVRGPENRSGAFSTGVADADQTREKF